MEKSSKRGKIPQHDWPSIISRYESGETLASIARTYDCSPPAISYIVSRTRARGMAGEGAAPKADLLAITEPQLVKTASPAAATHDISDDELMHSDDFFESKPSLGEAAQPDADAAPAGIPDANEKRWSAEGSSAPPAEKAQPTADQPTADQPTAEDDRSAQRSGEAPHDNGLHHYRLAETGIASGNGSPHTPAANGGSPPPGEARRTLHLSLPQGNGSAGATAPHPTPGSQHPDSFDLATDARPVARPGGQTGYAPQPRQPSVQAPHVGPANQPGMRGPATTPDPSSKSSASGAFIDHALRERINDDIAAFLAAFDAALDHDTAESRTGLREATDRLLRAGARTRIELERLEARVPLAAREAGQRPLPIPRAR